MIRPQPLNNKKVTGKELLNNTKIIWNKNRRVCFILDWIKKDLIILRNYMRKITNIPFDIIKYASDEDNQIRLIIQLDNDIIYENTTSSIKETIYSFYKHWNDILNMIEHYSLQYDIKANNHVDEIIKRIKSLDIFANKSELHVLKCNYLASKYDINISYLSSPTCILEIDRYKENDINEFMNNHIEQIKKSTCKVILAAYLYKHYLNIQEEDCRMLISFLKENKDIYSMEQLLKSPAVSYDIKNELLNWQNNHPLIMEKYLNELNKFSYSNLML